MRFSLEVQNILRTAREMAAGAGQALTTGHLLLAMLTCTNRAGAVLSDLKVEADAILDAMSAVKRADRALAESEALLELIEDRMLDAARHSGAVLVSSLHLLLALTREKTSVAYRALKYVGMPPVQVRTMALGRITGPLPRAMSRPRGRQERAFRDEPSAAVALAEPAPRAAPARTTAKQVAETTHPRSTPAPSAQPQPSVAPTSVHPAAAVEGDPADDPYALDPEQFPMLTSLGRNLSSDAAAGLIDPVIGRDRVIDTIIDVLNKRRSNNPCLVGEPGVGKTAIVEGLAMAIAENADRLAALRDRVIIAVDVGSLVAGTELRGSFSRRMAKLKDEVRSAEGRIIVFIDEIHTLVGAGSGEGALDAANDLKAALSRGEFPCIGATTPAEYHRHIERDPALERRFQPIEIEEPSEADALAILQGVVDKYEAHHGVMYRPAALEAAVRMSRRYIVDRRLPDKAFNLIDTAAARAIRHGNEVVELADIASVVSELTQIPVERLLMTDAERVLSLRDFLGARIIGHDGVLDSVTEVIQRNSAGFSSRRPIGSFLFLGPSGVGKTQTAKVLAEFLFCSPDAMTRFDMSEYMERHAVSKLLGAAPGYVGHEDAGQLTAALSRRPYQIVLLDEIEKAHPDVLNILLQILDEGQITDAKSRTLSLQNTVIIMTSNLGAKALSPKSRRTIGFGSAGAAGGGLNPEDVDRVHSDARKHLPPELWGRIDEKCVYAPLGRDEIAHIAQLLVADSSRLLGAERSITYTVSDSVVAFLIDHDGYDPTLGARPMRRAIQRWCETTIARAILGGEAHPGDHVALDIVDDVLVVASVSPAVSAG